MYTYIYIYIVYVCLSALGRDRLPPPGPEADLQRVVRFRKRNFER